MQGFKASLQTHCRYTPDWKYLCLSQLLVCSFSFSSPATRYSTISANIQLISKTNLSNTHARFFFVLCTSMFVVYLLEWLIQYCLLSSIDSELHSGRGCCSGCNCDGRTNQINCIWIFVVFSVACSPSLPPNLFQPQTYRQACTNTHTHTRSTST